MRGLRSTLVITISVGLLVGSSVGVAAQEAERAAPVEVTGTAVEGACPGGSSEYVGLVEESRGWVCLDEWSMSDPRLEGTLTRAWNLDFYQDGSGLVLGYETGRLDSADGSWQQRPRLRAGFEGRFYEDRELLVFDGVDAYADLMAVVWRVSRADGLRLDPARLEGYIVEGDYPPPDYLAQ